MPGLAFYMDTNADCDIGSHNLTASQHKLNVSPLGVGLLHPYHGTEAYIPYIP